MVASIYFENASADLDPLDLSVIRGCVRDGLGAGEYGQVAAWHGSTAYQLSEQNERLRGAIDLLQKVTNGAPYPGERVGEMIRAGRTRRWAEEGAGNAQMQAQRRYERLLELNDRVAGHRGQQ